MYSINGRNNMLSGLGAVYLSLHTAIPDETGASEVTTAGGIYARQAVTYGAPGSGAMTSTNTPTFTVPAGTLVVAVGAWTASSGGTYLKSSPSYGGSVDGIATIVGSTGVFTSPAHALSTGFRVGVVPVIGRTIPSELSATTLYWVVNATTNTFQISATSGGSAITLSGDNVLYWQKYSPDQFNNQGSFVVSSDVCKV